MRLDTEKIRASCAAYPRITRPLGRTIRGARTRPDPPPTGAAHSGRGGSGAGRSRSSAGRSRSGRHAGRSGRPATRKAPPCPPLGRARRSAQQISVSEPYKSERKRGYGGSRPPRTGGGGGGGATAANAGTRTRQPSGRTDAPAPTPTARRRSVGRSTSLRPAGAAQQHSLS